MRHGERLVRPIQGEHTRLSRAEIAHVDTAAAAAKMRSDVVRQRHLQIAALYRDTLARLPAAPPNDPDSVVRTMSSDSTTIDSNGHYELMNIRPGQYFVVTPGVGWSGAVVGHFAVRLDLDLRPGRLQAACAVLGTASPT